MKRKIVKKIQRDVKAVKKIQTHRTLKAWGHVVLFCEMLVEDLTVGPELLWKQRSQKLICFYMELHTIECDNTED